MARNLLKEDSEFPVKESELELTIPIDKDVTYWLRPLTVDTLREFNKKNTRQVPNKRTHRKDDVTDDVAVSNDILDYAIVRWEGVKFDGVAAPCELAHKLLLPVEVQVALVSLAQAGDSVADHARSLRQPD